MVIMNRDNNPSGCLNGGIMAILFPLIPLYGDKGSQSRITEFITTQGFAYSRLVRMSKLYKYIPTQASIMYKNNQQRF